LTHKFDPANMARLLTPERKQWNDPELILGYLQLGADMVFVEVGCGPGWFTIEAAKQLSPHGLVYGVDIRAEMLAALQERADAEGLTNVKPVLAEGEDEFPVPTESADSLLLANIYHEVDPQSLFLNEIARMLKPGGTCLMVDWKGEPTPMGPPLADRIDQQDVVEEFTAGGFLLSGTCDVGPYHYGLKFKKINGV
jgi:ubiquinone/menaquinone biosynthesis C-methylase UbiE